MLNGIRSCRFLRGGATRLCCLTRRTLLVASLALSAASCGGRGALSERGERYLISTFPYSFESEDPFWPELRTRIDEIRSEERASVEHALDALMPCQKPPVVNFVHCLDAAKCASNVRELFTSLEDLRDDALASSEGVVGPFRGVHRTAGAISFLVEKHMQWSDDDLELVIKEGKALRLRREPVVELQERSFETESAPSWLNCRNTGLHCDPFRSMVGSWVNIVDVSSLLPIEIQQEPVNVTYRRPYLRVSFGFGRAAAEGECAVRVVNSGQCERGAVDAIETIR